MDPLLDDFAKTQSTPVEVSGKGAAKKPRAASGKGQGRASGSNEGNSGEKDRKAGKCEAPDSKWTGALVNSLACRVCVCGCIVTPRLCSSPCEQSLIIHCLRNRGCGQVRTWQQTCV